MGKVRLEIEVDEQTASDVETLETRFFAWTRAKTEEEKNRIVNSNDELLRRNPQALMIHMLRPPHLLQQPTPPDSRTTVH